MRYYLSALCYFLALPALVPAADQTLRLTIETGKVSGTHPVRVVIDLPEKMQPERHVLISDTKGKGKDVTVGQLTAPSLALAGEAPKGKKRWELTFILKDIKAKETLNYEARITEANKVRRGPAGFSWAAHSPTEMDLSYDTRKVLRYVHPVLDDSTPQKRESTYKVFHHVFDPKGKELLTKGVGGQYTHHRGLFFGFMKCRYDKTTVDIWHCKKDTHQAHVAIKSSEAGRVLGRHLLEIDWKGDGKKTFARELRELTAYAVPGGTLIEFASKLTPTVDSLTLDGDPQHAGFHFRASNEVATKTKKETIFIRPDGDGKPGTERNWDGKKNKTHINLPWLGMSFVLGKQRYTAAYLDLPTNPKEARFSERTYGRVGSYFVKTVTKDKPLLVRYRVWVQEGRMKGDEIKRLSEAFGDAPKVTVK